MVERLTITLMALRSLQNRTFFEVPIADLSFENAALKDVIAKKF